MHAIGQSSGFRVIALALRDLQIVARCFKLFLDLLRRAKLVLFRPPARGQFG